MPLDAPGLESVKHLSAAPSSSAPRLAARLFIVMGEILLMIVIGVGLLTAAGWVVQPLRGEFWMCWPIWNVSRCELADRPPVHLYSRDLP
jgi:hypothetical protein